MIAEPLKLTGFHDMPKAAYHSDTAVWSRGMIADFRERRSICHAKYILGTAPKEPVSRRVEIGDLAHAALLEPHRLASDYWQIPEDLLSPDGGIRTNAAKDWVRKGEAQGAVVLRQREFQTVSKMVESVKAKVGPWFTPDAKIEQSVYWIDSASGLPCRARPDVAIIRDELVFCLDIKTTGDVSPDRFRNRIEDGGLLLQDAHYSDGLRAVTGKEVKFLFVAVESNWPWTCAIYEIDQRQRETGWANRRRTMMQIADCIDRNHWTDHWENEVNTVRLRPWALEVA